MREYLADDGTKPFVEDRDIGLPTRVEFTEEHGSRFASMQGLSRSRKKPAPALKPASLAYYGVFALAAVLLASSIGVGLAIDDGYAELHTDAVAFFARMRWAWDPQLYLGTHSGFMHAYATPVELAYALLQLAHVGSYPSQRLVDGGIFFAIGAGMYWALGAISPDMPRVARFAGGLAYLAAIYVPFNLSNSSPFLLPYAMLPVAVGLAAAALDRRGHPGRNGIATGFAFLLGGFINPPLVLIGVGVLLAYVVAFVLFAARDRRAIGVVGRYVFFASSTTVLLSAYAVVPLWDYLQTFWRGSLLDESPRMHNADSSFWNVFRGAGQWGIFVSDGNGPWYPWAPAFRAGYFSLAVLVVPLVAILGIASGRSKLSRIYYLLVAIASIPLAVGFYRGEAGPALTTPVYDWLYHHVPDFAAFRSSYKFVWPFEFAICGLFAETIASLARSSVTTVAGRLLRRATIGVSLALVASTNVPMFVYGENHASASLPPWYRGLRAIVGDDRSHRLLVMPSQYLESYDWADQTYYVENALTERPLVAGYISGAPLESSHVLLTRAFHDLRLGNPDARNLLATLSVDTILQRDDFRNAEDFAFIGGVVGGDPTSARDQIERVLRATRVASRGALHAYALPQPRPLVYAVTNPEVVADSSVGAASNADFARAARGRPFLDIDATGAEASAAVLQAGNVSGDPQTIAALAATSLRSGLSTVECPSATCLIRVARAGTFHIFAQVDRSYPPWLGEPFGATTLPTDDGPLTLRLGLARRDIVVPPSLAPWRDAGVVRLRAGNQVATLARRPERGIVTLIAVPQEAWRRRRESIRAELGDGRPVALAGTVDAERVRFQLARASAISVAAWLPRTGRVRSPIAGTIRIGPMRRPLVVDAPGKTIDLPVVPRSGYVWTRPCLAPKGWYVSPEAYRWGRGNPQPWLLLADDASFDVYNPSRSALVASVRGWLASVGRSREVRIESDGIDVATVRLRNAVADDGDALRTPRFAGFPEAIAFRVRLRPGRNRLRIRTSGSGAIAASRVDSGNISKSDISLATPSLTVGVPPQRGTAARIALDETARPIALPRVTLDGDPHLVGDFARRVRGEFAVVTVVTDASSERFRLMPLTLPSFDVPLAGMQSPELDDQHARIRGIWLISRDARAKVEPALREERNVGWVENARNPVTIDGRPAGDGVLLGPGWHEVSALPGRRLGRVEITSGRPRPASDVRIAVSRPSPVALAVDTAAGSPFVLVFGESFHPEWQAQLEGRTLQHVRVDGFANGWLVPAARSQRHITIAFTAQRYFDWSLAISLLSFPLAIGGLLRLRP